MCKHVVCKKKIGIPCFTLALSVLLANALIHLNVRHCAVNDLIKHIEIYRMHYVPLKDLMPEANI